MLAPGLGARDGRVEQAEEDARDDEDGRLLLFGLWCCFVWVWVRVRACMCVLAATVIHTKTYTTATTQTTHPTTYLGIVQGPPRLQRVQVVSHGEAHPGPETDGRDEADLAALCGCCFVGDGWCERVVWVDC